MSRLAPPAFLLAAAAIAAPAVSRADGCPLPCSGQSASPPETKYVYVQPAGDRGRVIAYDTRTRKRAFSLPAGMSSADGRWHFSAARRVDTVVSRFELATGRLSRSAPVRGRWHVAGVSPTGRWIALVRWTSGPDRTALGVVDADRMAVVHRTVLRGDFEVETISADGKRLFLIQHLREDGSPNYLVRLYDLSAQRLRADPLRSANAADKLMTGYAWSGVASPDGRWLLTLYLNTTRNSAFVHALDLRRSRPLCIDLPSGRGIVDRLKRYALTLSPDGRRLFASNPVLGTIAEIDLGRSKVVRTTRFPGGAPETAASRALASGAISRNGRTLYFSGGRDLWAYDAAYGLVRGPYPTNGKLLGFGYGKGDRRIYAVRRDGRVLVLDAATGRALSA